MTRILLLLPLLAACSGKSDAPADTPVTQSPWHDACGLQADGSRTFRILHMNDTYRIEGLSDGRGGMARVATLRQQLQRDCGPVLVTHAGDLLYPSLLSRKYGGEQMIDVLNHLDGDGDAMDPYLVATPGNHEFDKSRLKHAERFDARIEQSQFLWLDTNIDWKNGDDGQPLIAAPNLSDRHVFELAGLQVAMFSVTADVKVPDYASAIRDDYLDIVKAETLAARQAGADVVLALTHLDARMDARIVQELSGDDRPDLILGGHNHVHMTIEHQGAAVLKADADATSVRVVDVTVGADGSVRYAADSPHTPVGPDSPEPDAQVAAVIDGWLARYEADFCGERGPGCLDTKLTVAKNRWVAEELEIRRYETNLGDWVSDLALGIFAPDGAQMAFVNSGSLRLNQDVPEGSDVTRQIIEEIFAYPAPMHLIEVDGAVIQQMLERSIYDWTGSGHFLQMSGIAWRHDTVANQPTDIHLLTDQGPVPLDPKARYKVVIGDYLINPDIGDQDGYSFLSKDMVVESPRDGTDLKDVVLEQLKAAGEGGLALSKAGRICSGDRDTEPCLLPD